MLLITIEFWPNGDAGRRKVIAKAMLSNDGTGGHSVGNYDASFTLLNTANIWKRARVEGFPRLRRTPWDLLYRALREAVGDRNEPGHERGTLRPDDGGRQGRLGDAG